MGWIMIIRQLLEDDLFHDDVEDFLAFMTKIVKAILTPLTYFYAHNAVENLSYICSLRSPLYLPLE